MPPQLVYYVPLASEAMDKGVQKRDGGCDMIWHILGEIVMIGIV